MGLLDFDANKLAGNPLLQIGMGILANNSGNYGQFAPAFGRGINQGMQNATLFAQQQQQNDLLKQRATMQDQEFAFKKAEFERAQQNEAKKRDSMQRLVKGKPAYFSKPDGLQNANYEPVFNQDLYAQDLINSGYGGELIKQQLTPQEIKAYKPGDVLYRGSERLDAIPEAVDYNKPFLPDGTRNSAYQNYELSKARSGASVNNVSVNTGQKGFDNTLKLRGDFRSEPIYKAHQEVRSAHSQISAALKQASPAGDLAGATKLMKILDPGSVVRESELGMAMAASGAMDRLTNYAQMTLSGQKLTPTQRKDFQSLSDSLLAESSKQYNAKRAEYKGISERNGLNEQDVLGEADKLPPKPRNRADILKQYGVR